MRKLPLPFDDQKSKCVQQISCLIARDFCCITLMNVYTIMEAARKSSTFYVFRIWAMSLSSVLTIGNIGETGPQWTLVHSGHYRFLGRSASNKVNDVTRQQRHVGAQQKMFNADEFDQQRQDVIESSNLVGKSNFLCFYSERYCTSYIDYCLPVSFYLIITTISVNYCRTYRCYLCREFQLWRFFARRVQRSTVDTSLESTVDTGWPLWTSLDLYCRQQNQMACKWNLTCEQAFV